MVHVVRAALNNRPFHRFSSDTRVYNTTTTSRNLSPYFSINSSRHHRCRRSATRSAAVCKMRSSASYYAGGEYKQPHFLDSCFLCHKHLSQNSDIYMYRGNTPFCSQECRQEQIEMDESKEKRLRISSKRSSAVRRSKDSSKESDTNKAVRTGTVAVA